jgi:hypothetical protein
VNNSVLSARLYGLPRNWPSDGLLTISKFTSISTVTQSTDHSRGKTADVGTAIRWNDVGRRKYKTLDEWWIHGLAGGQTPGLGASIFNMRFDAYLLLRGRSANHRLRVGQQHGGRGRCDLPFWRAK